MTDFSDNVKFALAHIGDCIASRRIANGQRQQDLATLAGESVARVSNLENGKDGKLSLLLSILESTGMLEEFLEALPVEKADGKRVRLNTANPIEVSKPLNKAKFMTIINRQPDAELPVNTKTAYYLRELGFALRKGEVKGMGEVFIATTLEHAKSSKFEWEHIDGRVGGFKPIHISIPKSNVSDRLLAEHQLNPNSIASAIEVALSEYKVSVTADIGRSKTLSITSDGGKTHIDSKVIHEIVASTIQDMESDLE